LASQLVSATAVFVRAVLSNPPTPNVAPRFGLRSTAPSRASGLGACRSFFTQRWGAWEASSPLCPCPCARACVRPCLRACVLVCVRACAPLLVCACARARAPDVPAQPPPPPHNRRPVPTGQHPRAGRAGLPLPRRQLGGRRRVGPGLAGMRGPRPCHVSQSPRGRRCRRRSCCCVARRGAVLRGAFFACGPAPGRQGPDNRWVCFSPVPQHLDLNFGQTIFHAPVLPFSPNSPCLPVLRPFKQHC
jgi:hypothetical protein